MTNRELIAVLQTLPPEVEIITHANNHTAFHGGECKLRIALISTYVGPRICIGNFESVEFLMRFGGGIQ